MMVRQAGKWIAEHLETVIMCVVVAVGAASSYGVAQYQISDHDTEIKGLQADRVKDRELLVEIKTHVEWIRRALDGAVAGRPGP